MNGIDRNVRLVAVTGGIGSGKSVVCRILRSMGHDVYDCDSRARRLMDESEEIMDAVAARVMPEAVVCDDNGRRRIDRKALAAEVFSCAEKLAVLNSIVHGEVRRDIDRWVGARAAAGSNHVGGEECASVLFVESAIVIESGLHDMVDYIWHVTAPAELRLERAMRRDGATADEIKMRMRNQKPFPSEVFDRTGRAVPVSVIVNDGRHPLLARVEYLLGSLM